MSEETTFTFKKTKYFFPKMNKMIDIEDLNKDYTTNGEGNYEIVLCSNIPSNIYDCIDSNGCLDYDNNELETIQIQDEYIVGADGEEPYFNLKCTPIDEFNEGFVLSIDNNGSSDVQIKIGDRTEYLKGAFIVRRSNDFIVSYAISSSVVAITNFITLPFDSKLLSIGYCSNQL